MSAAAQGARPPHALRQVLAVLAPSGRGSASAVVFGALALASAVALTAVSAWLVSRAAQHPSIVALGVAVVAVRALGVSRGVFRYLERLASHDVALRGTVRLREQLYLRLSRADRGVVAGLRHGELLARVGADADLVADVLVRGLLPFAVAGVVTAAGVTLMVVVLPAAGAVLAGCLLVAAVLAPWLAGTSAARALDVADRTSGELSGQGEALLAQAVELTVTGQVAGRLALAARSEAARATALDEASRPAALAAALSSAATGLAVLGCLATGVSAVAGGRLDPVLLALVALTPLALVEVVGPLPAAAAALVRGRLAAERLLPLLTATPADDAGTNRTAPSAAPGAVLRARSLACGWPDGPVTLTGVDLDVVPGELLAVVGPSGGGKSTLLRTLAGLLPPVAGAVRLDGTALTDLDAHALRRAVTLTAEDAHVFTTTLRDNLLVARGDATDIELATALARVGLATWVEGLDAGLDTALEPGVVSGGERRRLLVARALLVGSRVLLLDEPLEHLDAAAADALMGELAAVARAGAAVVVVTHDRTTLRRADRVVEVAAGSVASWGR